MGKIESEMTGSDNAGARVWKLLAIFSDMIPVEATYRDSETGSHAVQVVGVTSHSDDLGHNGLVGPLHSKYICQFLQVLCAGLTDAENSIAEPRHAEAGELLIEELDAELRSKERKVLNDGQSHTPLLVLGKLNNRRQE